MKIQYQDRVDKDIRKNKLMLLKIHPLNNKINRFWLINMDWMKNLNTHLKYQLELNKEW